MRISFLCNSLLALSSAEFLHEAGVLSGVASADLAVICINATKGIELMARKAWDYAGDLGLARMVVISRMDSDNVSYNEVLASIRDVFCSQ